MSPRFKCPDSVYWYLQRRRDHLISVKVHYRMLEREAEEARSMGWLEEAERLTLEARKYLKLVREIEEEIAELESKCFVGEEDQIDGS